MNIIEWPYKVSQGDVEVQITEYGDPVAKPRPRFDARNRRVFTPAKGAAYEKVLRTSMWAARSLRQPDGESCFALRCLFYRSSRQRIDCDNLLKAVSDAANGAVWKDDSQVMEVVGRLVLADAKPRVEVLIHRVTNPSPRARCEFCLEEFVGYESTGVRFCSRECYRKSRVKAMRCERCKGEFELLACHAKRRKGFCSVDCAVAAGLHRR